MASKDDKESKGGPGLGLDTSVKWEDAVDQWGDSLAVEGSASTKSSDQAAPARGRPGSSDEGALAELSSYLKEGGEVGVEEESQALGALLGTAGAAQTSHAPPEQPETDASPVPRADPADVVEPFDRAFDQLLEGDSSAASVADVESAVSVASVREGPGAAGAEELAVRTATPAVAGRAAVTASRPRSPAPLPLDAFDELVPDDAATPLARVERLDGKRSDAEVAASPTIFDGIEAEAEQEDQVVPRIPPLPGGLEDFDLSPLTSLETVDPLAIDPSYWERLEGALALESEGASSAAAAADLEYAAAFAAEMLGNEQAALQRYREVLAHRPKDMAALLAIWRLDRQGEEDPLPAIVELLRPPARRALAALQTERESLGRGTERGGAAPADSTPSGRPGRRSCEATRALCDEDADDLRRLVALLLVASASGEERERLLALERLATAPGGDRPVRAAAYLALAWSRDGSSSRDDDAALMAYREAARLDPSARSAWEGVLRTAWRSGQLEDAAEALQIVAERAEHWSPDCLLRLPAGQSGAMDEVAALKRAVAARADDPALARALAAALLRRGDLEAAAEAFSRVGTLLGDGSERAEAYVECAELLAWRADVAPALAALEQALSAQPDYPPARRLRARLQRWSAHPGLRREACLTAAARMDGRARAAEQLRAAYACLESGDAEAANSALAAAMVADPDSDLASALLVRACEVEEDYAALADAFDGAARAATREDRAAVLRIRAAEIYEQPLARPSEALNHYRDAAESTRDEQLARQAQFGVQRALQALNRPIELANTLAQEAGDAGLPASDRAALLVRAGNMTLTHDRVKARDNYDAALALNGAHEAALWQRVLATCAAGDWRQAADDFGKLAEGACTGQTAAGLWLRAAGVLEGRLEATDEALLLYQRAQQIDPAFPGTAEGAVRCLRRAPDEEAFLAQLAGRLEDTSDARERFVLSMVTAGIHYFDPARDGIARRRLESAREIDPQSPFARHALFVLQRRDEAWDEARELILSRQLPAGGAPPLMAHEQLAEMARRQGSAPDAAILYEAALARDSADVHAAGFLRRHRAEAGQWDEYVALRRREVESVGGGADAGALWLDLGQRLFSLAAPAAASEAQDSQSIGAGARLSEEVRSCFEETLYRDPRCTMALHRLLDDAWAANDHERMAVLYEQLGGGSDGSLSAAICHTRAGELREDDLYSYRCALQHADSHVPAFFRLRDSALRAENWALAYEAVAAETRHSKVPERVMQAHRLAAEIAGTKLDDQGKVAEHLRQLIHICGDWDHSFDRLRGLLRGQQRWEDLIELLSQSVAREESSEERTRELHREIAVTAYGQLQDHGRAKSHLRALLQLAPDDEGALDLLARLCEADGEWEEAAEVLFQLARLDQESERLGGRLLQLGKIYQDHLGDKQRAKSSLRKAVQLNPGCAEALERLAELYLEMDAPDQALDALQRLTQIETNPQAQVDLQLRMGKICEDRLADNHRAGQAFRRAMESAADDLKAIGALCGFYARQGDQRSVMIHLDTALSTMRERLRADPYEAFAAHAMFKIFGWRRNPDGCLLAAQVLDALGQAGGEERDFLESHAQDVAGDETLLGATEDHDELLFDPAVPGGFRHIFRLLATSLSRLHRADVRTHGVTNADRIDNDHHPVRSIGDALAVQMGVPSYELYIAAQEPTALIVENTDPPAIILGADLVRNATEEEIQFLMGRCLWIMRKAMILPARLRPGDLDVLITAVVRNYLRDFLPAGLTEKDLQPLEKQVAKAIPRRLRQELMPFALECSGGTFDPKIVGPAVVHSANRAGLLACRSVQAAYRALRRAAGPAAEENPEAEALLHYAVSDAYLQLRKALGIAIS